jgi:hypothetical protein
MRTNLDCYQVERRLGAAVCELKAVLQELGEFESKGKEAGVEPPGTWHALSLACQQLLEELDGLGNGCPSFVAGRVSLTVQSS